jgi:hypothetical protein
VLGLQLALGLLGITTYRGLLLWLARAAAVVAA